MTIKGIDVSSHNGLIDWEKAKKHIDFAIIRAGFGKENIDTRFERNISECNRLKIPAGAYWFSYAYNEQMALNEAKFLCSLLSKYEVTYPVAFDFEYDSVSFANKHNVVVTSDLMYRMADIFLKYVCQSGYKPILYTNLDFYNRGFDMLAESYDLWFAQWKVSKPSKPCAIWQYADNGTIEGVPGQPDLNISYVEYRNDINNNLSNTFKLNIANKLPDKWWQNYRDVAKDVIDGKYGNGDTRKAKLKASGFDYTFVQTIVNYLLGK
mgnify:CR=1 FL=1